MVNKKLVALKALIPECPPTVKKDHPAVAAINRKRRGYMLSNNGSRRQISAHPFLADQLIRTFWDKEAFDTVIPQLSRDGSMTSQVLLEKLQEYRKQIGDREGPLELESPNYCDKCAELPNDARQTMASSTIPLN